jgi:uncharacterized protein YndB with AHSA1/START domain
LAIDSLRATTLISQVTPAEVYRAWVGAESHGAMTGGAATAQDVVGGDYTTWDGYIQGKTLALDPDARVLQTWRTDEFPDGAPDSQLEVLFVAESGGTRVTLNHTHLPVDQVDAYAGGWEDHYFTPMKAYFAAKQAPAAPRKGTRPAAKRAPAKKAAPMLSAKSPVKKAAKSPVKKEVKKAPKKPVKKASSAKAKKPAKKSKR